MASISAFHLSSVSPKSRVAFPLSPPIAPPATHGFTRERSSRSEYSRFTTVWRSKRLPSPVSAIEKSESAASAALDDLPSLFSSLKVSISEKDSEKVKNDLEKLKGAGFIKLWNSYSNASRRTTFLRELTQIGIKNAENLAIPSVRNDLAFLVTVVGSTSILAVIAGQLPGDWGFFVPYLLGGVSLVVLAIGSVAPGLFEAVIGNFSKLFPDYKQRILRHEAAHFLTAYLLGVPIVGYSLDIGNEHVNLLDDKLQKRLYSNQIDSGELDRLAVVSMAGLASEGLYYDKVVGQSADLFSLQRLLNRSQQKLSNNDQQNLTRWAALYACSLLKNNASVYDRLNDAMDKGEPVENCIAIIEGLSIN